MLSNEEKRMEFTLSVAKRLQQASDSEFIETFHLMRRQGKLSRYIRGLNALEKNPTHSAIAKRALKQLGLDDGA